MSLSLYLPCASANWDDSTVTHVTATAIRPSSAPTALDLGQFEGLDGGGGLAVPHQVAVLVQQSSNKVPDKSWAGSNIQSQCPRSFVIAWILRFRNFWGKYKALHRDTVCLTGTSVHYCNQWKLFTWGRDQLIPNCVFLREAAKTVR